MSLSPRAYRSAMRRATDCQPLVTIDARAITLPIELVGERVHAARKNVGKAAKQIDLHLPRRDAGRAPV